MLPVVAVGAHRENNSQRQSKASTSLCRVTVVLLRAAPNHLLLGCWWSFRCWLLLPKPKPLSHWSIRRRHQSDGTPTANNQIRPQAAACSGCQLSLRRLLFPDSLPAATRWPRAVPCCSQQSLYSVGQQRHRGMIHALVFLVSELSEVYQCFRFNHCCTSSAAGASGHPAPWAR